MALELRFTIPGQIERVVPLDQPHIKIGALLSNQVVLRAPGVDPIHALIEEGDDGSYVITDLGSQTGIKVNGRLVDVEQRLNAGDVIHIGSVTLNVGLSAAVAIPVPAVATQVAVEELKQAASGAAPTRPGATVRVPEEDARARRMPEEAATLVEGTSPDRRPEGEARKKEVLFSPRKARPAGDVLECVAYWGDTVLEVELFHPSYKGFHEVTIGDPTKAHMIAAGKSHIDRHTFARMSSSGFKIYMRDGMQGRLRRGGKVEKVNDSAEISLGSRDIAHIKYGAVSYFLMYVRPPALDFPRSGPADPFFLGLMSFVMLLYFVLIPIAWMHKPAPEKKEKDDIWQVVQVPEQDKKPEPEKKKEKPEIKISEKKTPPKKPPKPTPKPPIKPAKAVEKEKPKQPKPVEKPVEQPKPTEVLTEQKPKPTPPAPTPQKPQEAKPAGPPDKPDTQKPGPVSKVAGTGMPSTGAKAPDNKLAGPTLPNTALGKAGGAVGSGMNQPGGAIKGTSNASVKGVEGPQNNKPSGVNLSKLGLGVGKIMSKTGAGAISTNFKDSAGGAGGGMGSASKTYGMGGVGNGKSLGLAGAGGSVNNFGSGSGGLLSGQGGLGGGGGNGLGGGFGGGGGGGAGGHGRANVTVPPGDPVVSGGLTAQEIMAVIRANLNQVRHCYEQLLQRSPNAAGKMTVTFVIDTSGRVQTVSVPSSTISDSMMRGCVTGKISRWAFPKPRGGQPVTVNYPFVFNPL